MKKTLLLISVAFMTLTANASMYEDVNYIEKWGQLKLVGNQLSAKNGAPVQLKGWSIQSILSPDIQDCIGKDQFELMKHYGANIVRLAMPIDDESDGGSYMSNKEVSKEKVKGFIDDAYAAGMYVMVDWHTLETNGKEGNPLNQVNDSKDFFSEISSYAKQKDYNHILYELCNEPKCDSWETIKSYAEEVIPVILKNQPEAMIIVGTNNWCQDILEPLSNPISAYKNNVLYSFHYYSCSHYYLLGNFRSAQHSIPVFVSEWSAVKFDGSGPFCNQNSNEFIHACGTDNTPQLVSWCVWNWNKKGDDSSFITDGCGGDKLSQLVSVDGTLKYGSYVIDIMGGRQLPPPLLCCLGSFEDINVIPSTDAKGWHWDAYNYGGEGIAYHDANSSAWEKDEDGVVLGYNVGSNDEVDVFSLAVEMQWLREKFPYSTVEDGKIVDWDEKINTVWKDVNNDNKPTYKSLNAGRMYSGTDGSRRPDGGVDLMVANCKGTVYQHSGYNSLYLVEKGEWIKYTVNVEKPGYYKISGIISSEYKAPLKNGEISIISEHGNHLRDISALTEDRIITSFGFPRTIVCDDPTVADSAYWDCWTKSDAISGDHKEVLCVFENPGEQEIMIKFKGDASGVGPLIFDWYTELDPDDPITCGDCGGWFFDEEDASGLVGEVVAVKFSINPNPTSGDFTITLAEDAEATVEVVNMAGQVVASQNVEESSTIDKVLATGVYTVVVKSNGGVGIQKLVVK